MVAGGEDGNGARLFKGPCSKMSRCPDGCKGQISRRHLTPTFAPRNRGSFPVLVGTCAYIRTVLRTGHVSGCCCANLADGVQCANKLRTCFSLAPRLKESRANRNTGHKGCRGQAARSAKCRACSPMDTWSADKLSVWARWFEEVTSPSFHEVLQCDSRNNHN